MNGEINQKYSPAAPKRALFVVTQSEMGGAQRFYYNFISGLDRSKYEILIAVGSDGGGDLLARFKENGFSVRELKFLKRDISFSNDLRALLELRRLIKNFHADTLFLNSSKAGFVGSLAARLCRKTERPKVIYRIGGWTFNDPWPQWKKRFWIILEKISARWKDVIIVNNKHDFEQAQTLKIRPKQKITLIYNGLDVYRMDFFPREEARLKLFEKISRQAGRIFQAEKIIGTIANFYPPKGLEFLVEAAEFFKNDDGIAFFVIGDGEDRQKLEGMIKEKGLEKKIFLPGRLTDAHRFLPAFDLFVLPSLKEGFPWSLIEAMAAKLPVIAAAVGAVPEIIEDGKNGIIVKPGDAAQIAAKIKEILTNDRLAQEMGIQAHQTVLFKFNAAQMNNQTEAIL
ncbi:MAG: Glycosyltransferase, group 1 family [Parcubacteria group bacterium GW2011_GWA1_47_9]|nr:MAG: Glycosyltransferase, group 1 family [Parcubacteria group bacterium GW2011_GWA1_47_9]